MRRGGTPIARSESSDDDEGRMVPFHSEQFEFAPARAPQRLRCCPRLERHPFSR